jgi:hypothetical protein
MAASIKPAEESDLTEDGDRDHPPHRIQLRPLERHREEEKLQGTTDLAREICSASPGISSTTGIESN